MGQLRLLGEPPASDDHAVLANLAFPQAGHTGFVASAGVAGGQTIIGGLAAAEHLTLQSTADASRGWVRAQDDLQLLSNKLRDSAGNQRVQLATAYPHIQLTGDITFDGLLGTPSGQTGLIIRVARSISSGLYGAAVFASLGSTGGGPTVYGLWGNANYDGTTAGRGAVGLAFIAYYSAAVAGANLRGLDVSSVHQGAGNINLLEGLKLYASWPSTGIATVSRGAHIGDFGKAGVGTAYGLQILDQTAAATNICLEIGPATPYLRVIGGAAPAAGLTNLYANVGGTLHRVSAGANDSGGAGYRLLRVPN